MTLGQINLFKKIAQNGRILLTTKITSWFLFVFTVGYFEKSVRAALTIFSLYVCLFSGLSTWSDHPVWRFKTIKKVSSGAFQFISILAFRNLKCAQYQQNKAPDWLFSKFPPKWRIVIGRIYLKWLSSVSHQKIISSFVTTILENYDFFKTCRYTSPDSGPLDKSGWPVRCCPKCVRLGIRIGTGKWLTHSDSECQTEWPNWRKNSKERTIFKFIFGSFRLVDTDDDLTRPVQTLINWVPSETGGMSAMVHMDAGYSNV